MLLLVLVGMVQGGTRGAQVSSGQEKRDLNIGDFIFFLVSREHKGSPVKQPLSCQVSRMRGLAPGTRRLLMNAHLSNVCR